MKWDMRAKRILIIDDSKTQLTLLQMELEKSGFDVITAGDGLEGVNRAFIHKPDLIISDIMMPELNGYQLARLLKNDAKTSHIPIILLTSLDQRQDRFWGIRAGANQYVVKTSDLSTLKEAIGELLNHPVSPSRAKEAENSPDIKGVDEKSIKTSVNHLLDKLLFESTLSSEARILANFIYDKDNLLKKLSELVNSLIDYSCLCICLFNLQGTKLYFDIKHPVSDEEMKKIKQYLGLLIEDNQKKSVETFFVYNSLAVSKDAKNKISSHFNVPLRIHGESIGYLTLHSEKPKAFTQKLVDIINLLGLDFAMVFKLLLLYDEVKELSITDGLTELYNKHYFLEVFDKEFERAKRFNNNMSLIMMDIDFFKSVNDTYGHLQGDTVLKEMGSIIKQNIRKTDFPARYGGEEFVILAINADIQNTTKLAEKIRKVVESHSFKAETEPLKLTVSFGVATATETVRHQVDLIKMADDALYQAKKSGRNKVCTAPTNGSAEDRNLEDS